MHKVKPNLAELARKWPSAFVARQQVPAFTGGAISAHRIANLDCAGEGPRDRIRIGRKVCYSVDSLVAWLEARATSLD